VREILEFLKDYGAEQFMSAIGEQGKSPTTPHLHPSIDNNYSTRHKGKISPMVKSPSMNRAPSMRSSNAANVGSVYSSNSNTSGGGAINVRSPSMRTIDRAPSLRAPSLNRAPNTQPQVQLDKLILCRFGNLNSDVQRVLRTASIIGITFSLDVLQNVLPQKLQTILQECLQALFNQKWLYQDEWDEYLYQFAHPHAYRVIYELIPSAERNHTHQLIANYIESRCITECNGPSGDKGNTSGSTNNNSESGSNKLCTDTTQYGVLSFHYQHCDTDKALQYAVKATENMLQGEFLYEISDCVDLLTGCVSCCKTTYDIEILLKLIDTCRVAVRTFTTQKYTYNTFSNSTKAPPTSWLKRVGSNLSALVHNIVPLSYTKPSTVYVATDDADTTDTPVLHNTTSNKYPNNTNNTNTTTSEDLADKRTKRLLLQQLSRIYDQLHENLNKLRESGSSGEAKEWQVALLAVQVPV